MKDLDRMMQQQAELMKQLAHPYAEIFRQEKLLKDALSPHLEVFMNFERESQKLRELIAPSIAADLRSVEIAKQLASAFHMPALDEARRAMALGLTLSATGREAARLLHDELHMQAMRHTRDIERLNYIVPEQTPRVDDSESSTERLANPKERTASPRTQVKVSHNVVYDLSPDEVNSAPKIELPPGTDMAALARRIFSREQVEEVFDAIVADYRHDFTKELARGGDARALKTIDREYRASYCIAFVRELGPVIWRLIVAIGVALRIAG